MVIAPLVFATVVSGIAGMGDAAAIEARRLFDPSRNSALMADVYTELARRLGVMPSNVTHTTKPTLIN